MSGVQTFVGREILKLETELTQVPADDQLHAQIYAARQALSWALDPNSFASPYAMLLDKRGENSVAIEFAEAPLPQPGKGAGGNRD